MPAKAACDSADRKQSWQTLARDGSAAFNRKDYQTAATSYLGALRMLPLPDEKETRDQLRLNLAETYISDRKFDLAKQQLDEVNKSILVNQKSFVDPLLPSRYFRRLAQLLSAQGRSAAAVAAFSRSMIVFSESFDSNHRRTASQGIMLSALLNSAAASWDNQPIKEQLDALNSLNKLHELSSLSKPNLVCALTLCRRLAQSRIKGDDLQSAAAALKLAGIFHNEPVQQARQWLYWWWQLARPNSEVSVSPRLIQQVSATISEQLEQGSLEDVKTTKHILLAGLAYVDHKHELAHNLLKGARHNVYESGLAFESRSKMSLYCFNQAIKLLARKDYGTLTEQFLLDALEVRPRAESVTPSAWRPVSAETINVTLARLYLFRNNFERAATILDTIPEQFQERGPDVFLESYTRVMLLLAKKQRQSGDIESAERHFKTGLSAMGRIQDKRQKADIQALLKLVQTEMNKRSNRNGEEHR